MQALAFLVNFTEPHVFGDANVLTTLGGLQLVGPIQVVLPRDIFGDGLRLTDLGLPVNFQDGNLPPSGC